MLCLLQNLASGVSSVTVEFILLNSSSCPIQILFPLPVGRGTISSSSSCLLCSCRKSQDVCTCVWTRLFHFLFCYMVRQIMACWQVASFKCWKLAGYCCARAKTLLFLPPVQIIYHLLHNRWRLMAFRGLCNEYSTCRITLRWIGQSRDGGEECIFDRQEMM